MSTLITGFMFHVLHLIYVAVHFIGIHMETSCMYDLSLRAYIHAPFTDSRTSCPIASFVARLQQMYHFHVSSWQSAPAALQQLRCSSVKSLVRFVEAASMLASLSIAQMG